MPKSSSFFKQLRTRLSVDPPREFDRQFWKKMDTEFFPKKKFYQNQLLRFALGGVAALFIFIGVQRTSKNYRSETDLLTRSTEIADFALLEDLDLLETFDDIELTDQDWETLLG